LENAGYAVLSASRLTHREEIKLNHQSPAIHNVCLNTIHDTKS